MTSLMKTLILSIMVSFVVASPNGPPVSVPGLCENMVPGHGPSDATGDAPYTITAVMGDSNTYTVRLEATTGSNATFRGFFLQARPWDSASSRESQTASLGTFASSDAGTKTLGCFSAIDNTWGHSSNTDKSSVEGTWTAPAGSGDIRFRVSVVQGPASTYWTDIYSDVIMYGDDTMTTLPMGVATTESSAGKAKLNLAAVFGAFVTTFLAITRM